MTKTFKDENIGVIEFAYNAWTGRFNARINGVQASRLDKRTLKVAIEEKTYIIYTYGNVFTGINFTCEKKTFKVTEKAPWYVYVLGLIPFIMTMVFGNVPYFAQSGFYYIGGAIGGAISGMLSFLAIFFSAFVNKHIYRLLILFGAIIVTFLACWGLGNAFVMALQATNA